MVLEVLVDVNGKSW